MPALESVSTAFCTRSTAPCSVSRSTGAEDVAAVVALPAADGAPLGGPPVPGAEAPAVAEQVGIHIKYAGYIARQLDEIARQESHETTRIPVAIDYAEVRGLSIEVRQKLAAQRPATVGQAARISGITPAAISLLLVHLKRFNAQRGNEGGTGEDGGQIAA